MRIIFSDKSFGRVNEKLLGKDTTGKYIAYNVNPHVANTMQPKKET